jgi:uncharacterized protein YciI
MKNDPKKIREVIPSHITYWVTLSLEDYAGGPFADRSGGLISFLSDSLEEATRAILDDPFIKNGLIAEKWIKEWMVEEFND